MKKLCLAFMLISLAIFFSSCHKQEKPLEENPAINTKKIGAELAGINTEAAVIAPIQREVRMLGQVSATESRQASITSPMNGVISDTFVTVGEKVARGEPVAVLNNVYGQTSLQILQKIEGDEVAVSQAKDNSSQAKAELTNAQISLNREKILFRGGVAAKADVESAEERYHKALSAAQDSFRLLQITRTALERDKAIFNQTQLSGTNLPQNLTPVPLQQNKNSPFFRGASGVVSFYVRAPITGTIISYSMSKGLSVSPGTVLVTILNTDQVYVDASAYESDLPFVHTGDPVTVKTAAFPDKEFYGKISYIGKQVDPATRTVVARSLIQNSSNVLRPGMSVTARLTSAHAKKSLVVPENALLIHGDERYVFVETSPQHYQKRSVKIGITADGKVEILSGIKTGEKVVTSGNLLLEGQE